MSAWRRWRRQPDDPQVAQAELGIYRGMYDAFRGGTAGDPTCPTCLRVVDEIDPTSSWRRVTCDGCGAGLFVGTYEGHTWVIDRRLGRFLRSDGREGVAFDFSVHRPAAGPSYGTVDSYVVRQSSMPAGEHAEADNDEDEPEPHVHLLNPGCPDEDPTSRRFSLLEID